MVLSCLFSYLSISLILLFYDTDNTYVLSGISFILLTVISFTASILFSANPIRKALVRFFHKTPHNDIWRDVLDLDNGSNLKIYFKESNVGIIGHHKVHEENGENSWFAISAPIKFDIKTDKIIDDRNMDNEDIVVVFKLQDIRQMEIF